jgi:hypothetical protein
MYSTALESAVQGDTYAFVTSNSEDFSAVNGDKRLPHADLSELFAENYSTYWLGDAGLEQVLHDEFGDELTQIFEDTYFVEEPRGLADILAAEKELFDKVWYERSLRRDQDLIAESKFDELEELSLGPSPTMVAQGSKRPMGLRISDSTTRSSSVC